MTTPSSSNSFLSGRRGIVLGVSGERSVGFALATGLRALGADVAATYRPHRAGVVGPRLEAEGVTHHFGVEASDEASWKSAFDRLDHAWDGALDFVVHTLAHVPEGLLSRPLVDVTREDFGAVLEPSVHSLIVAARHAVPRLERSRAPRIVALTSASARQMTPNYHVMGIAKAALDATILYLAQELGPKRIACNSISFSIVPTDGAERAVGAGVVEPTRKHLAKKSALRTSLEMSDVVSTTAFFVSSLCTNVTGEIVNVDGGVSRSYF